MHGLMLLHATHPFWVWLAVAAIFLAIEVATGTGWMLWPAASGLLVGLLTLVFAPGPPVELGLFAVLTIAATYLSRRFLRPVLDARNPDLNDPTLRLVGRDGEALDAFQHGKGRVFVDGKEWAAVAPDGVAPAAGQKVLVVAVEGAVLTVR